MLAELLAGAATTHTLNGRAIAPPVALAGGERALAGYALEPRVAARRAAGGGRLTLEVDVRVRLHGADVAHVRLAAAFTVGAHCAASAAALAWRAAALPDALHALFAADAAHACPPGEARAGGGSGACEPRSCLSPRACPGDACRRVAPSVNGTAFACGCRRGEELNVHTLRCVKTTCDAPAPCPGYADCVPLEGLDLISRCNPTPSLPEQWVRGGPAPCPKFKCVPHRKP